MNSLGFAKPPAATRVVVAMSGGVDSSVTAALLKEEGYDVVGVTLQLYDQGEMAKRKGACCAGQDIYDAGQVAERLGFPHYVLDYESRFRESVIDDFVATYAGGQTPIPCVRCNQTVKFRDLLATARDLGAEALATGHYVRRVMGDGGAELHQAKDARRDQSYFLFATTKAQLDFVRFPLGDMPKESVRSHAARLGLVNAAKPDSQDICFVPDGDYAAAIRRLRPEVAVPGEIVDLEGRVLGRHDGIVNFTVGQRRGIGGGSAVPLYVVRIDAARRQVVVGPKAALLTARVTLREMNWLVPSPVAPLPVEVKLRSTQPRIPALVAAAADDGATLELLRPEAAVAPGQAGVLYIGDRVIGGGWIAAGISTAEKTPLLDSISGGDYLSAGFAAE